MDREGLGVDGRGLFGARWLRAGPLVSGGEGGGVGLEFLLARDVRVGGKAPGDRVRRGCGGAHAVEQAHTRHALHKFVVGERAAPACRASLIL